MWMCLQSQTKKLHFEQWSDNEVLARLMIIAWEHIPSQKLTNRFNNIPKVLQSIWLWLLVMRRVTSTKHEVWKCCVTMFRRSLWWLLLNNTKFLHNLFYTGFPCLLQTHLTCHSFYMHTKFQAKLCRFYAYIFQIYTGGKGNFDSVLNFAVEYLLWWPPSLNFRLLWQQHLPPSKRWFHQFPLDMH